MAKKTSGNSKPKAKTSEFGKTFDRVIKIGIAVLVVLIAITVYNADAIKDKINSFKAGVQKLSPESITNADIPNSPSIDKPEATKDSTPRSTHPNYDEYITYATENKWNPTDPLEKLNATIQKYSQIFDLNKNDTDKHFDGYIDLLNKEIRFLMQVFKQSTDRTIDLTPALFLSLDVAQQSLYSVMKNRLSSGSIKMITKTAISQKAGHWIYPAAKELMRFATPPSASQPTDTSHVYIDFDRVDAGGRSLLMKAVQFRLYGMISVLASFSPDSVASAVVVAINNGDDLALALLIKQDETLGSILSGSKSVSDYIQLAETHKFSAIKHRLSNAYNADSISEGIDIPTRAARASSLNEKIQIYNDYAATIPSGVASTASATECTVNEDSGWDPMTFRSFTTGSNKTEPLPECAVDRVSLKDITLERFHTEYVVPNRPVILTTGVECSTMIGKDSIWESRSLLQKYGDVEVMAGVIPYGTLFGREESTQTLTDFVNRMNKFTSWVKELHKKSHGHLTMKQFLTTAVNPRAKDIASSWKMMLPSYIFSGDDQKLNTKMIKEFMETIQSFGGVEDHLLVKFLQSISLNSTQSLVNSKKKLKYAPDSWKFQFFLGPALSGAPLHHHAPAFNFLLQGSKLWTILPPGRDIYSNLHPLEFVEMGGVTAKTYPFVSDKVPSHFTAFDASKPCEIRQKTGEVVYMPRHWTHQVLNLAESIGFAVEIQDYIY